VVDGLCWGAIFKQLIEVDYVKGFTVRRATWHKAAACPLRRVYPEFAFSGGIVGRLVKGAAPNKKAVPGGF
jgi:hypothetical protein